MAPPSVAMPAPPTRGSFGGVHPLRHFAPVALGLAASACARETKAPPPPSASSRLAGAGESIAVERDVIAAMRDGTKLFADVYRPRASGTFPVLLSRTPYDAQANMETGVLAASHGYIAVLQDVRGRYRSEGDFYPFVHESEDGYDSVEWAAALPGSNGRVGLFGASYVGATTLLAAVARPPHLAALLPGVTASTYHEGWTYLGGALEQWFAESWTTGLAQETVGRRLAAVNPLDHADVLPLRAYPTSPALAALLDAGATATLAPYFSDWLAHPAYDDFWRRFSLEERYDAITVPALHVGDWYDIFLLGTLRNYVGLKAHGGQRLRIGPGNHIHSPGAVDFGPAAAEGADMIRWFDSTLKGAPDPEKPVQIFVMGKNAWRGEDDWPLARAKEVRYRLHAGGVLSTDVPATEAPDSFVYDPADPVPTRGGGLCCDGHLAAGPADQRPVEARKDVLLYTTPPFEHDVEVTGPVTVELYVSSTARDTDFTAKLVDVWPRGPGDQKSPSGLAQNLADGIVRMRYRDSRAKASFLAPGTIYAASIDLAATSNVFRAGHRMRLEVSSSNFPRFDRNLNTEESPEQGSAWVKATNTVHHDAAHASALVVQVVPAAP